MRGNTSKATPTEKAPSATTEIQIRSRLAPAGLVPRSDVSLDGFFTVPVGVIDGFQGPLNRGWRAG